MKEFKNILLKKKIIEIFIIDLSNELSTVKYDKEFANCLRFKLSDSIFLFLINALILL